MSRAAQPGRAAAGLVAVLVPVIALMACTPPPPPNVVVIVMDTTRLDHLSAYGYPKETSLELAALGEQGVRFDAAYAPTASTAPTHASLFTALHPSAHGVVKNGVTLRDEHATLAEAFASAGYETKGVVSSFVLKSKFGLARGFESWDDDFTLQEASQRSGFQWEGRMVREVFDRRADHATRRAIRWLSLERDRARPFFLFVHYFDPHDPYRPPAEWAARFAGAELVGLARSTALYDAEIAYTDQQIGVLLEALSGLGLSEETLIVVSADHGEGLHDHGHMAHGAQVYEEAVRVPLILRWPGVLPAGSVRETPVGLVDLAPTLLDLAGVDPLASEVNGRSFADALRRGTPLPGDRPVWLYRRRYDGDEQFGDVQPRGEQFGVRLGRWKYVVGDEEGTRELFDLDADPTEQTNLVDAEPDTARELAARIEAFRQATVPADAAPASVGAEDRARLRALGYTD